MVILGLGTNLDDRLGYLQRALQHIQQIPHLTVQQISPIYVSDALLPENAPHHWNMPYFNLALRCETALSPHDLLHHTKLIEERLGRKREKNWSPRLIDIDLLAWDDLIIQDKNLHIPHEELTTRPFALWPLADVAPFWINPLPGPWQGKTAVEIAQQWGSRFDGHAPLNIKQIPHLLTIPQLVGIINITPDSFSDGRNFISPEVALKQFHHLSDSGARIIDIGAEATGPNATPISAIEEWQRLEPILTAILAKRCSTLFSPKISIDTRHFWVAEKALALGVDWINDVSGLENSAMCHLLAEHTCDIVFMHHLGIPAQSNQVLPLHQAPAPLVLEWAKKRLEKMIAYGIAPERLIFDVGIGYGKTPEQSIELIQQIALFKELDVRLLVGHSRKSFLKLFTANPPIDRDIETLMISKALSQKKIDYLRIHNVELHSRALRINV